MKKTLIFVFSLILVSTFSLNLNEVLRLYSAMVDDYNRELSKNEFVSFVKSELVNMSLYRFYKNKIVGSMEKREFALNISDFLHAVYLSKKSSNEDEALARALFLAYVNARLQGKNLTVSIIKKTSSFNQVYDDYGRKLRYEAYSILKHLFAYYLGATDEKPPLEISGLEIVNLGYSYKVKVKEYPHISDISKLLNNGDMKDQIVRAIGDLAKRSYKDAAEFRRELSKKVNYVMRFFDRAVASMKEKIASLVVEKTPKESNLWWIRFPIYAALLLSFLKWPSAFKWILTAVLAFESIYMILAFNMNSLAEGLYYSISIFFSFSFVLLLKISKPLKNALWITIAGFFVIFMFVPAYTSIENLSMSENPSLERSPFYDFLKSDLYTSDTSGFRLTLGKLISNLSASREGAKYMTQVLADFVYKMKEKDAVKSLEITQNGIYLTFPKMSDYYSHRSFDLRISDFRKLESMLGDFIAQEKARKRRVSKYLRDLTRKVDRIVEYSADYLRKDFKDYLKAYFSKKVVLGPVLEDIEKIFKKYEGANAKPPSLMIFQTRRGLLMVMLIMMGFTAYHLGLKNFVMPILLIAASLYPFFSRNLNVFVQYGVKPLSIAGNYTYIPVVNVLGLMMSFLMFYEILKRRSGV